MVGNNGVISIPFVMYSITCCINFLYLSESRWFSELFNKLLKIVMISWVNASINVMSPRKEEDGIDKGLAMQHFCLQL